jgi:hypothetical protein
LYAARHRVPAPPLARWLLGLGIAATLTANMAQGWSHGPVGAIVAAWPAVSLVGSYELLVWLIRTSGAPTPVPPAGHPCENAACHGAARSAQPQPLTASSTARAAATCPLRAGGRRVSRPARSMVTGFPELVPIIARRWPRTGSACKLAIRSLNASLPRCSDAPPAAGHVPGSPKHGNHREHPTRSCSRRGGLRPMCVAYKTVCYPPCRRRQLDVSAQRHRREPAPCPDRGR